MVNFLFFFFNSKVANSHASIDGTLRDFCDGEDFKKHQLFSKDPQALVLHCYYDDFEVTNPLGSKTRKHKIGTCTESEANIYLNLILNNTPDFKLTCGCCLQNKEVNNIQI